MAKSYFNRYVWLIDVINRHGHISFKDISYLWSRSPLNTVGENYLPERTFHNHREAIFDTFGIEIKCDRSLGYYIANSDDLEADGIRQWLLESLSMNNLLNETKGMRDGKQIEMTYQSFWSEEPSTFNANPYCLKLFKQRWYMLAKSEGKDELRIYSLDERMLNVVQTDLDYKLPAKCNAEKFFADYFGIIVGADYEPQTIKIRVAKDQEKYFDTLPLHDSQKKEEEESDESYSIYRYHLAPTFDFKQELLSRGPAVEVLEPKDFREEIMDDIAKMASRYMMPVTNEDDIPYIDDEDEWKYL